MVGPRDPAWTFGSQVAQFVGFFGQPKTFLLAH